MYPLLRLNDQGPEVQSLQGSLRKLGFAVPIDGYYGYATFVAVREFQNKYGILVSGITNYDTWVALKRAFSKHIPPPAAPLNEASPLPSGPLGIVSGVDQTKPMTGKRF